MWIGSSLRVYAHSPPVAWSVLAVLGVCVFGYCGRRRLEDGLNRVNLRLVVLEEGLFTIAFLAFVGIRIMNPDLWQPWFGGEKTMEIAYLNALNKSAYMPPYDPYFSGGYLNYYYYGQVIASVLLKLTGVRPEIGFNLAVATFFSLSVAHVLGLGYQLGAEDGGEGLPLSISSRGLCAGLSAVTVVLVAGNLSGVAQLFGQFAQLGGGSAVEGSLTGSNLPAVFSGIERWLLGKANLPPFDYWYQSTRLIPYTINEFPFFSFLFADLHPHMIAIPFALLAPAFCLVMAQKGAERGALPAAGLGLSAISIGALGPINTWDLPMGLGLLGCGLIFQGYALGKGRGIVGSVARTLLLVVLSLAAYAPFYARYRPQHMGLGLVPSMARSGLALFLLIWGLFVFLAVSFLGAELHRDGYCVRLLRTATGRGWQRAWEHLRAIRSVGLLILLTVVLGAAVTLVVLAILGAELVLALLLPLLVASALLLLTSANRSEDFLRRLLLTVGLGTLLGVEIVYLRDFLADTEWLRMNTVFKFYSQAWVLLGLSIGSSLPVMWRESARMSRVGAVAWRGAFGLLLASSLIYTALAVPARVTERFPGANPPRGTLDGLAFMATAVYSWPDEDHPIALKYDREAIEWLWNSVEGTPVLAEAPLGFYREGGLRVSSYTGLPTLLGAHEQEQRPWRQVSARERDAEALFRATDNEDLFAILYRYRVRYIYVGQLERAVYAGAGLEKFERLTQAGLLKRVFHNERVDIYKVPADGASSGLSGSTELTAPAIYGRAAL